MELGFLVLLTYSTYNDKKLNLKIQSAGGKRNLPTKNCKR